MKRKSSAIAAIASSLVLLLSACGSGSSPSMPSSRAESAAASSVAPATSEAWSDGAAIPGEDSMGGETYLVIDENQAKATAEQSLVTFSLKVDTASYTNVARYLESGSLPPKDAVRTEELVNYFPYDQELSFAGEPFAIYTEVGPSPFDGNKRVAMIRVKSQDIDKNLLPSSNLTFLIDTSGSMDSYDKLPLLKEAFRLLVDTLDEDDKVSIVTYAGSSEIVLDSASGQDKDAILRAIDTLSAGGSTAGAQGIATAYSLAEKNFRENGNNRVILATDGDFNVGLSNTGDLGKLVEEKRDSGVYLSILGFGTGNIRDDIMETLSKQGNGNYAYINSTATAQKVLVDELAANLFTVADDVKAQIEFNPENVTSHRLIGYENRRLNNEDFEDDSKDAGEIGVGTDVVMLFELELAGSAGSPALKYGGASQSEESSPDFADELFEVRIRYKDPGESESKLLTKPVTFGSVTQDPSSDYRFACSVAAFGHLLRDSEYKGDATIASVMDMAEGSLGRDAKGYRNGYLELLRRYQRLAG